MGLFWIISFLLKGIPLQAVEWEGEARASSLKKLDSVLAWMFQEKTRTYFLMEPLDGGVFYNRSAQMREFAREYGYFSPYHPLVAKVTQGSEDVSLAQMYLKEIDRAINSTQARLWTCGEALSKVVAYRDLKIGDKLEIPGVNHLGKSTLQQYKVDHIFNLWQGMPAFGLVALNSKNASILLFRGTDPTFSSVRGWASVMSDLDVKGPGLTVFQKAQNEIHDWLKKQKNKTRAIGFSLGGVLAAYTLYFEHEYITDAWYEPSMAFCPPGVSKKILNGWKKIPDNEKPPFIVFVDRGDLVSKVGYLFGTIYELSSVRLLKPIAAHQTLMTAESTYFSYRVDSLLENDSR